MCTSRLPGAVCASLLFRFISSSYAVIFIILQPFLTCLPSALRHRPAGSGWHGQNKQVDNHSRFQGESIMKQAASLVVGALCAALTMPVIADSLSGDEIRTTFSGKTAVGDHLKKGMGVRSFHANDGSYRSVLSDGTVRTGKWWVDVNELCVNLDGKDNCNLVESDTGGGYMKVDPKKGKAVVHFKTLENGDTTQ